MFHEFNGELIRKLRSYCKHLTNKYKLLEADELLSMCYLRLHSKLELGINLSYAYTTARRLLIDEYKKKRRNPTSNVDFNEHTTLSHMEDMQFWFTLNDQEHLVLGLRLQDSSMQHLDSVVSRHHYYAIL